MRRSLPAFPAILLAIALPAAAQAVDAAPASDSAPLRAMAGKLLASGSADDTLKAADLLAKASEIDEHEAAAARSQAEAQKLREPAQAESGWKVLVDVTPFLSFVIVALGFFFNSWQKRVEDREKREEAERRRQADAQEAARVQAADEEKRWADAVALMQKTEDFSPAAAMLSTFLTGSHAALARKTAGSLILTAKRFANFSDLFNTFMEPVTRANLDQALGLLRSVSITVAPLLRKAWVNDTTDTSGLAPDELESYNLLTQERTFLGAKAAAALRQPRTSAETVDLSNIGLDDIDLSGADLRDAIAPSTWNLVNLDGADLRGMRNIENTWVYNTAWWHASRIDRDFLALLIERAPFRPEQYSNTPRGISAEDYGANVARLEAQA